MRKEYMLGEGTLSKRVAFPKPHPPKPLRMADAPSASQEDDSTALPESHTPEASEPPADLSTPDSLPKAE